MHENLLRKFFAKFGQVKKCKIIRDSLTSKSKGFGYVEFINESDASGLFSAKKEEIILNDREIKFDFYREKPKTSKKKKRNSNYIFVDEQKIGHCGKN